MKTWMIDGVPIPICDLDSMHLLNIIRSRMAIAEQKYDKAFEKGCDSAVLSDFLPEVWDELIAEAKKRRIRI